MPALRLASLLLFLLFLSQRGSKSAAPAAHRRFLLQEEPIFRWNQSQLLAARSESEQQRSSLERQSPCEGASRHTGFPNPCSYALEHEDCQSGGLVEYIQIFYCIDAENRHPRLKIALSSLAISLWLIALFYMLGNTAADYFCSCLERLSQLLRLPPTVAGVTLLPLGNGAADVFACVASFAGTHHGGKVGINSVLGGAVFVGTVVAGLVNILVAGGSDAKVPLDGRCFVRDGVFFLASLGYLTLVLWKGRITVWEALGYLGIYVVYALVVAVWEIWRAREKSQRHGDEECGEYTRLEGSKDGLERVITVPAWLWASQVAIYSHHQQEKTENQLDDRLNEQHEKIKKQLDDRWNGQQEQEKGDRDTAPTSPTASDKKPNQMTRSKSLLKLGRKASQVLIEWPLALPRTLTIPVVDESRWSRPKAVIAATLAPILLAAVWCSENASPISDDYPALIAGAAAGIALGLAALLTTVDDRPPRAPLLWITAGFFMSMVWFYVIARELVAALVSLAAILGVDAAILGVTVLAWGNSMGDLVANSTLASRGGSAGIQIAIAGCYSTPMFNTLFGLGVSFLIVAARSHSQGGAYDIPGTGMAMVTVAFLGMAIVMAMVGLAVRGMRPSRSLGVGLIVLYGGYMVVRACEALGVRGL